MFKKRNLIINTILIMILIGISFASLVWGRYPIRIVDLFHIFCGIKSPDTAGNQHQIIHEIVFTLRLPRLMAGLLVGMALSMAGTTFQAIFRNPLVSPELLGVMGGALCGLTLGFMLDLSLPAIQLMAFGGGLLAVGITLTLAHAYKGDRVLLLILSGIITGGLFLVIFKLLEYNINADRVLPNLMPWVMGGLGLARGQDILLTLPFFAMGIVGMLVCAKALNVLTLGEEAATLGVNPTTWRLIAILSATLVSSLTVTVAGIVAWIGLVVPHLGRLLTGQDNRLLLPVSAVLGAALLILADDLSRSAFIREMPLGVTMSFIGIPLFLILLFRINKSGSTI
jgi:iron complex transport system permease protein